MTLTPAVGETILKSRNCDLRITHRRTVSNFVTLDHIYDKKKKKDREGNSQLARVRQSH